MKFDKVFLKKVDFIAFRNDEWEEYFKDIDLTYIFYDENIDFKSQLEKEDKNIFVTVNKLSELSFLEEIPKEQLKNKFFVIYMAKPEINMEEIEEDLSLLNQISKEKGFFYRYYITNINTLDYLDYSKYLYLNTLRFLLLVNEKFYKTLNKDFYVIYTKRFSFPFFESKKRIECNLIESLVKEFKNEKKNREIENVSNEFFTKVYNNKIISDLMIAHFKNPIEAISSTGNYSKGKISEFFKRLKTGFGKILNYIETRILYQNTDVKFKEEETNTFWKEIDFIVKKGEFSIYNLRDFATTFLSKLKEESNRITNDDYGTITNDDYDYMRMEIEENINKSQKEAEMAIDKFSSFRTKLLLVTLIFLFLSFILFVVFKKNLSYFLISSLIGFVISGFVFKFYLNKIRNIIDNILSDIKTKVENVYLNYSKVFENIIKANYIKFLTQAMKIFLARKRNNIYYLENFTNYLNCGDNSFKSNDCVNFRFIEYNLRKTDEQYEKLKKSFSESSLEDDLSFEILNNWRKDALKFVSDYVMDFLSNNEQYIKVNDEEIRDSLIEFEVPSDFIDKESFAENLLYSFSKNKSELFSVQNNDHFLNDSINEFYKVFLYSEPPVVEEIRIEKDDEGEGGIDYPQKGEKTRDYLRGDFVLTIEFGKNKPRKKAKDSQPKNRSKKTKEKTSNKKDGDKNKVPIKEEGKVLVVEDESSKKTKERKPRGKDEGRNEILTVDEDSNKPKGGD